MILKFHIELNVATKEAMSEIKIRYSTGSRIQAENPLSEILTNCSRPQFLKQLSIQQLHPMLCQMEKPHLQRKEEVSTGKSSFHCLVNVIIDASFTIGNPRFRHFTTLSEITWPYPEHFISAKFYSMCFLRLLRFFFIYQSHDCPFYRNICSSPINLLCIVKSVFSLS